MTLRPAEPTVLPGRTRAPGTVRNQKKNFKVTQNPQLGWNYRRKPRRALG
jgi:hypothetical protein